MSVVSERDRVNETSAQFDLGQRTVAESVLQWLSRAYAIEASVENWSYRTILTEVDRPEEKISTQASL